MANEINVTLAFSIVKDEFSFILNVNDTLTSYRVGKGGYTQAIGTSEEVIDFGDIVTNGPLILKNLDSTNYVVWGPESSGAMVECGKLMPGEFDYFRVKPGVILRAKANTAACLLDVNLFEGT